MPSQIVQLPWQFNGLSLSKVAGDLAAAHAGKGWPPEIQIDFGRLGFVRPAGMVFLSNMFTWLRAHGTTVTPINVTGAGDAVTFLDDALFFEQHFGRKLRPGAAPRSTTRPLMQIAHENCHDWLEHDLLPWLAGRLNVTRSSLYDIKNCIAELFNNIQDHTQLEIGTICAQHFPRENRVYISLADLGLGIPTRVRTRLTNLTDAEAIIKATELGFTTKSVPGNQGAGLDVLLGAVVRRNGGAVSFYSSTAIVRFGEGRQGPRVVPNVGFCPGTTIDIVLRTDAIERLPDQREDLEW
ncbi:MAG TPA: hypothetical protein VF499_09455 [Afipia sp.]